MPQKNIIRFNNVGCDFYVRKSRLRIRKVEALKNVSFDLHLGETLGLVGHNGSGKSTLLQIIGGILNHTSGEVFIPKDLSTSLLSLQLGFANELTGVENAVLGAMYLGHTKQEALARLPKILEFAEIGEWANESLFTYSTGMKARLGFAVALEMNPDIMLIDETMGVGDAYFQKKSTTELIKKMQSGQTTVLVSHSEDTIRSLCNRVLWLRDGKVRMFGNTDSVMKSYMTWMKSLDSESAGAITTTFSPDKDFARTKAARSKRKNMNIKHFFFKLKDYLSTSNPYDSFVEYFKISLEGRLRQEGETLVAEVPELAWLDRFPQAAGYIHILDALGTPMKANFVYREGLLQLTANDETERFSYLGLELWRTSDMHPEEVCLPIGSIQPEKICDWGGRGHLYSSLENLPSYDAAHQFYTSLVLFEDRRRFERAQSPHPRIERRGRGAYSFWGGYLVFSASNNSNPSTNGKKYDYGIRLLSNKLPAPIAIADQYRFHLGKDDFPMPTTLNLGVTNVCNLRCTICGSQATLQREPDEYRHIDLKSVRNIAETIFPYVNTVTLNSYGEPTLHPHFPEILSLIRKHRCCIFLQSNGTRLSGAVLEELLNISGTLSLSVDATEELFETVRVNAKWDTVNSGIRELMSRRDPDKLKVKIYPTLSRRTIKELPKLLAWAEDIGMDMIDCHYYEPTTPPLEETPTEEEKQHCRDTLVQWAADHPDGMDIELQTEFIRDSGRIIMDRKNLKFYSDYKAPFPRRADVSTADPDYICMAPICEVDTGLEGEIFACCRAQLTPLGRADSDENFFNAWLGKRYEAIRISLERQCLTANSIPNCRDCIKLYTGIDEFVDIHEIPSGAIKLTPPFTFEEKYGYCIAVPDLIDEADSETDPSRSRWELFENRRSLGKAHTPHGIIREVGGGGYSHWKGSLFFSSSDNSDPNENGYVYYLMKQD